MGKDGSVMTITYTIDDQLYVNLTNRCSNRCDFCIRQNGDTVGDSGSLWLKGGEPTQEQVIADILGRDLKKFRDLVFCGYGEPTERLDVLLAAAKAVRAVSSIPIRINTNGQADLILGRRTAPELKGLIDVVSISLNASDADKYDKICHSRFGKQAFDALLAYAADCKAYVPHVVFSVVDCIGPEEVEKCRTVAQRVGVEYRVRKMIN